MRVRFERGDSSMKNRIQKSIFFFLTFCMVMVRNASAFDGNLMHNTLIDNAYVIDTDNFMQYYVGYSICSNDTDDWGLMLEEEEAENSTLGRMYLGSVKMGSTLSASVDCTTSGTRLVILFEALNQDSNTIGSTEASNETDGLDHVDCEFTVPEGAVDVALVIAEFPVSGGYGAKGTVAIMAEFQVNGTMATGEGVVTTAVTEEPQETAAHSSETEPSEIEAPETTSWNNVPDSTDRPSGSKKSLITGAVGIGALIALVALFIGSKPKGCTKTAKVTKACGTANEPGREPAKETYTLKDPVTGAEMMYVKNRDTGEWVSSDGSSVLDTDKLPDWTKQRSADREWQNVANMAVQKPTRFEDIDVAQARAEEQITRETYYEKIAIKHGMDSGDMDAVYEKVAHDQAKAEVGAQKWTEVADHNDTGLKISENLKTTADYSVSALGAVTGPAGTIVKDIYTAGTTIGGDVSEAIAEGKDAYEVAQTTAAAVTKTAVGIIQNHATGVSGKAGADIAGGAVSGGINAYIKGEDVSQGVAIGTVGGIMSASVDAGGEMLNALKDSNMADGLKKDLASELSDAGGDFLKNKMNEAVSESFEKTLKDLKPKNPNP